MSDSTPPPPPPPEPGEPGQRPFGGMSGGEMKGAVQAADRYDLGQIGLGVLIFIASLMPFYTYSFKSAGFSASASVSAWHAFFGWFGVLLALGAAGVLVAVLFLKVALPPMRLIVLSLFGAATVCLILALFITPGGSISAPGYDTGHGFGYWLALLCSLGATALAFMRKDATD